MTRAALLTCLLLVACSRQKPSATAHADAPHVDRSAPAAAPPRASARIAAPAASAQGAPPATSASAAAPPATSASAAASAPEPYTPKAPKSLTDFLPKSLEGIALGRVNSALLGRLPRGAGIGAYLDMKKRKAININLMPVQDLATARAQLHGLKPGQTMKSPAARLEFKAFDVEGFTVVRVDYLDSKQSEADAVLADKVQVMLSVDPASDPDESVKLMRELDLPGIAAFAKKRM